MQRKLIIADIQAQIEARLRFFLEMRLYLKDIQVNKVAANDISSFLHDVIGVRVPENYNKTNELIEAVSEKVAQQFSDYQELKRCFSVDNPEIRLYILSFLLEKRLHESLIAKRIQKQAAVTLLSKADISFHDHDIIKSLHDELQIFLGDKYADLKKIIKIKEKNTANLFSVDIDINWNPVRAHLSSLAKKFDALTQSPVLVGVELYQDDSLTMLGLFEQLHLFLEKTTARQVAIGKNETTVNYLKRQITLHFEYGILIQNYMNFSNAIKEIINTETTKKEKNTHYFEALTHYCRLKAELMLRVDVMSTRIAQAYKNENNLFNQLKAQFYQVRNNIAELHQELSNLDNVQVFLPGYLTQKVLFDSSLNALESRINHCLLEATSVEANVSHSITSSFFDERQRQLQDYKQDVQRNREVSHQQKIEKYQVLLEPEASSSANLVVNMDIAYYISKLHEDDIDFIKSIYSLERGIKYRQIEYLITSKLGGSIAEIGNGSSHKRIYLNNLYSEIYTQAGMNENNISYSNAVTVSAGGMYRPHGHGHAHNSGELSFFNIKLVRSTLIRADITIENIEKIRQVARAGSNLSL